MPNGELQPTVPAPLPAPPSVLSDRQTTTLSYGGLLFLTASFGALAALVWGLAFKRRDAAPLPRGASTEEIGVYFIEAFLAPFILLVAAIFAALVAYVLLRTAGAATREVIPRQDYLLLSRLLLENNDRGIDQYIRLSSLGGFAGIFAKVGLSGLPLATIALTVIFAVMSVLGGGDKVFDLAKLTLGAFIGSYVQRSVSERIASGEQTHSAPPSRTRQA